MADTTHNVTIKATLDTSQTGRPSGSSPTQPASSGSSSSIAGLAAAGLTMTKTIQLLRTAFEGVTYRLSELNQRIHAISWMYRNTHSTIDKTNKQFQHITTRVKELQTSANQAIQKFQGTLDELAGKVSQTSATIANSDQTKVNSTNRATQAQDRQTQAIQRSSQAVEKHATTLEKSVSKFAKLAVLTQVINNASRQFEDLASLSSTESGENIFKWLSRIGNVATTAIQDALVGAGAGALAGSITGPGALFTATGGAIVGATYGTISGITDEIIKFSKETDTETQQFSQTSNEFAKAQEELRKATAKTIEQIRRDTRDEMLLETTPDQLESTLAKLEENILHLVQDISELNSRFVLGKIGLNDYNKSLEDMQDKLSREQKIRDELSSRYEQEQDIELSEIQRQVQNFDYISEILYKQIQLGKEESSRKVMKDGTWEDVLRALAEQNQENLFEQSKSKGFFAKMQEANFNKDWPAYEEAKREFEESQRNLNFGLQMRSGLASSLQEIFKEMMTYKGLNIRDFGSLAALGGFGSTSVLGDPMLDLQREQNRLLGEMLRAIRDQDNTARYL